MKWRGRQGSRNIQDRRGAGGALPRMRLPRGRTGGSIGGLGFIAVVFIVALALGVNPLQLLEGTVATGPGTGSQTSRPANNAGENELAAFVSVVVRETEDMWGKVFADNEMRYQEPQVVLFTDQTRSGCGLADARTGPFYCPNDSSIYIDLAFYRQLRSQFGAPGDFAQAYVIAHEIGHHVQNLTGVLPEFNQARTRLSQEEANQWSIRVELQADCYAGVWAAYAGQADLLESGDIEEALNAANQIGDDTLQERMQGYAVPKTFNHGTSAQRERWFHRGYAEGNPGACDTFGVANP